MKILHLTDLHFNQYVFSWIKEMQRNYDVICLTGDLIDARKNIPAKEQADTILEWLHELDVPIFVCSGNHDTDSKQAHTVCGIIKKRIANLINISY